MVNRRGSAFSGCLTLLMVTLIIGHVGSKVGQPYYRYYQFRDAAAQQARFAALRSDTAIRNALWATADSLSMPESAYHLRILHKGRGIRIVGAYTDRWQLWRYVRPVHFEIDVEQSL